MIKAKCKNLKIARLKAGLLQKEVAERAGITENAYSIIERGFRPVSGKTAKAISDSLQVAFDDAFEIKIS